MRRSYLCPDLSSLPCCGGYTKTMYFVASLCIPFNTLCSVKWRLGCTLWGLHCKRPLVKARKQLAHKFLELKVVLLASRRLSTCGHLNVIEDKLSRHRQVIQTVVSSPGDVPPLVYKVAYSSSVSLCHQVQLQTSQICIPCSRSQSLESGCVELSLVGAGHLCFSPRWQFWAK